MNTIYLVVEYNSDVVIGTTYEFFEARLIQHEHVVRTNKDSRVVKIILPEVGQVFNFDNPAQIATLM